MSKQRTVDTEALDIIMNDRGTYGYFLKNADYIYEGCSEKFAQYVGQDCEKDIVGKTDRMLFGDENAEKYRKSDYQVLTSGTTVYTKEYFDPLKRQWAQVVKVPLFENDKVTGILGVVKNPKSTSAIAELEPGAFSGKTYDVLPFAVFIVDDKNNEVLYVNKACAELFDVEKDKAVGSFCYDVFACMKGGCTECPFTAPDAPETKYKTRMSGIDKAVRTSHSRVKSGRYVVDVRCIEDVSEYEERDNKLTEAEKESQIKSEFLANMSHDLRTPLNTISGLAQLAMERFEGQECAEEFSRINDTTSYLTQILNDVLDMSRISNNQVTLTKEPFDQGQFVAKLKTMIEPRARLKGIEIIVSPVEPDTYLIFDSTHVEQVLVNILNNAVKYTPSGGRVTMTHEYLKTPTGERFCRNTITDTGVGMSPEFISKGLFLPFEREINMLSHAEGGTGLGVSIAKELTERMGGTMTVTSTLGVGTTFVIDIPYEEATKEQYLEAHHEDTMDQKSLLGMKVLVVEDNEINSAIVRKILSSRGMVSDCAFNGYQALEAIKEKKVRYDAVLMDIRMPGLDGLETTKHIRMLDDTYAQNVPIIGLSANAFADDIKLSLEAGMMDHLAKPVNVELLLKSLVAYVN